MWVTLPFGMKFFTGRVVPVGGWGKIWGLSEWSYVQIWWRFFRYKYKHL